MKINIKIEKQGEQTFYVQPLVESTGERGDKYILLRYMSELQDPPIILKYDEGSSTFIMERVLCKIDEEEGEIKEKLNNLAIDVFEALQQGRDLAAEDIPDEEQTITPYDPELIRVETSSMSLRQVYDMIKDGDINLSPDFQRKAIWDGQRKCRLIESILLRIPLPMFYFSADKEGKLSVVDGLQRLTAIKEFMNNELPLSGLEYLDESNGCTYSGRNKLDDRLYRRFNLTQIAINIIDSSSPTKVKYDIFRRLNTGGRPLNAQELRNCLASNALRNALRTMANSKAFKEATTYSISDERMDAQECALRFIYFRELHKNHRRGIEDYSGSMDTDLDFFADKISYDKNFPFDMYIAEYDVAMKNAKHLFGRHAFRKVYKETEYNAYRSVINKALFISLSVLLADYPVEEVAAKCKENSWVGILGEKISTDERFFSMLSYGTNGWKNLITTFDIIGKMIEQNIK